MLRISVNFKNLKFINIKIEIDGFYSNIDIHITIYNDFGPDRGSILGWIWGFPLLQLPQTSKCVK